MRLAKILDCLLYPAAFAAALPLGWLVAAWSEDASRSPAAWLLTVGAGALLWRLVSEQAPGSSTNRGYVLNLLICGAVLRGAGHAARSRPCRGAGARLDVYALGVLAGTHRRSSPWPPRQLMLLNALWLPTEQVLPRVLNATLLPILA
jgi:hypothetical protein